MSDASTTIGRAQAAAFGTLPLGLPALLYGLRMWGSVCVALYVAFRLQLDDPSWAGTTAAIVCQPAVGASLRKGWFRLIGTVTGALAIVALTAAFPQDRLGFMLGLALWGGACAMAASLLRNFSSYAAALAGYTAVIIAGDTLGALGGASGEVFTLALSRATEIVIGITCGTAVLALTDFGTARRALAEMLARIAAEIAHGLCGALQPGGATDAGRPQRRALLGRAGALATLLDQAAGEISNLPFRPRALQAAMQGLYQAMSAWRLVATHLEQRPGLAETEEAGRILAALPEPILHFAGGDWRADPVLLRTNCLTACRRLVGFRTGNASLRLLADGIAEGLLALCRVLTGVATIQQPQHFPIHPQMARLLVPDMLPVLIAAARAVLTIGAAELIWVETGWPSGATMVVFAAVTIILFAPREDAAFGAVRSFLAGTSITAVLAGVVAFAVLPQQTGFAGFCGGLALVLVPAGALSAQAWQQPMFVAMATNFVPLLAPTNVMAYDPGAFYNSSAALIAGVGLAASAFRLMPPLPPKVRTRRLLALTLRDFRRLATSRRVRPIPEWERHVYGRLAATPGSAELVQPARLVTTLAVGTEVLRLRLLAGRMGLEDSLRPALDALGTGDVPAATAALEAFRARLGAALPEGPGRRRGLRAQAGCIAVAEALAAHADYFGAP